MSTFTRDYVERNPFVSADAIDDLQAALRQIVAVCDDNAKVSNPELALKFVREVATNALNQIRPI